MLNDSLKYTLPRPVRVPSGRNVGILERFVSALVALFLLPFIARKSGFARWGALGLGFVLFGRAFSGHSYLYSTLGISSSGPSETMTSRDLEDLRPSELPRMNFDIKRSVTIALPRTDVYARLMNPESWLEKLPGVGCAMPPTRLWIRLDPHEKPEALEFEIFDSTPNTEISWRCHDENGHTRAVGALSLADAPGNRGTEMSLAFKTPGNRHGGVGGIIEAFTDRSDRLARKFLRAIKQICETGEVTTSQMRRT